ncbi:adenylate cyclase [Angomonas deanei]|uniref:Adenylate and Guanylate cyclase catalytic domain containing protein, putative n=1 Tax=Angomonas deanei TaxID=59799 RepID=A0A7G2CKH8_9TRYP|nr:adenylate cyclase [Angomonas deanei]CAD2219063.1 Adenylate and Guanylate cyclase catalytic domain containing protein, putative [Angomonas deanei]|eukprot:EPY23386.1 adenylate cyclase [Angomonas deanei]
MYDLGKRHYAYSVSIENMKSFTEPFLVACRKFLVEEWNVTRESRFLWFFNDIVTKINKGIADGETTQVSTEGVEGSASVFCLVYTDIEACDKLWKVNAAAMAHAVKQHNKVIRALIKRFSGYEVSRVENSFSVALKDAFTGLQFALAVQLEFMRIAPIAKEFQMIEGTEGRGDSSCWDPRTLRVRISVEHCTQANCVLDEVTNTYVYSGPSVNRCASILNVTCGGQILMAKETYQEIVNTPAFHDEPCDPFYRDLDLPSIETVGDNSSVGLDHFVHIEKAGTATNLKGIGYPVELISVTPRCLSGRKFIDKISYRKK